MTFKGAVTADVGLGFQPGLKALGKYSKLVTIAATAEAKGSLDLDSELKRLKKFCNENRWDFAVGVVVEERERVFWIEVHSATTSEVTTVLKKLQWLKDWLRSHGRNLGRIPRSFHWIASGKVDIPMHTRQYRSAHGAGIFPVGRLSIP